MLHKKIIILLFLTICVTLAAVDENALVDDKGFSRLQLSPSGNQLLFDWVEQPGLYLADLHSGRTSVLAVGHNTAYRACWSADGRYVAFKRFVDGKQIASLYNATTQEISGLGTGPQIGIPSCANNGLLAYTSGRSLNITDFNGVLRKKIILNGYCNQTPISPQGDRVAFTDQDDQLFIYHLATDSVQRLGGTVGCFEPQWSPDGTAVLTQTLDGRVLVYDAATGLCHDLGMGRHATWDRDGQRVLFTRIEIDAQDRLQRTGLYSVRRDGAGGFLLTNTDADHVTSSGSRMMYTDCRTGQLWTLSENRALPKAVIQPLTPPAASLSSAQSDLLGMYYFDIPYLHQAYDTPDWFNGNWACGATAAAMCLAYYGLLNKWPATVSQPYVHVSDYGRYICEKYTYNGFTFDIGGDDPNGHTGWGGYGYIIKDNWLNTKQYMADYAQLHGLSASVDWSPSRSKIQNELKAKMPTVVLTSLTSAGHYVTAIGYDQEATSIMFNDPWGDKNLGYANYQGRHAVYDWPGFSNGHASLETVHCFIYFRGQRSDLTVQGLAKADTVSLYESSVIAAQIANSGMIPSAACTARLVLSTNAYFDSTDIVLAEQSVSSLAVNEAVHLQMSLTLPDTTLSGVYALGLQIDSDHANIELNETNNFIYTRLTVIGCPRIYGLLPKENDIISETRPVISCFYNDKCVAIEPTQVRIEIDRENVTGQALCDVAFVNYQPTAPLAPGEHTVVVTVFNKAAFKNQKTWHFSVRSNTGVAVQQTPSTPLLLAGYPNPFNHCVTIRTHLPAATVASVEIFSITGAHVATLYEGVLHEKTLYWDGCTDNGVPVGSGVYLCRLQSAVQQNILRLLMLK